jgi:hypothetical protein
MICWGIACGICWIRRGNIVFFPNMLVLLAAHTVTLLFLLHDVLVWIAVPCVLDEMVEVLYYY